jgi:hypothetical protein
MAMNNTFDLNRFALLIKRKWQEFGKIYLVTLLVVTGVTVLIYMISMPKIEHSSIEGIREMRFRIPLFLSVGFLFISIVSSSYFISMGQKSRAIGELMVPGSTLEKFLCAIFYTGIVPIFSYLVLFTVVDLMFIDYLHSVFKPLAVQNPPNLSDPDFQLLYTIEQWSHMKRFYLFPFTVTSVFLLGSIYFSRFQYIKTAIVLIAFIYFISYSAFRLSGWLNQGKVHVQMKRGIRAPDDTFVWSLLATVVLTVLFWYIGYIRLKEKEV